jgi:FAD:protein FMN transferase
MAEAAALSPADSQHVYRTNALGTVAELVTSASALFEASEMLDNELASIDRVASRFRSDSELSRLNASAGSELVVGHDLFEAIETALAMAAATDGLVDPTVGTAMTSIGYDRDFSDVVLGVDGDLPPARAVPGWRCISIDPVRHSVSLPAGTMLDLGATAKALAADRAATAIHNRLGCRVLVSLGGDVSAAGPPPDGGFLIGIADTCTSTMPIETVSITSGGLASSGIGVRRWRLGSQVVHHIVDPATSLPVTPIWRTASVAAANCVQANAASTAAMVLGEQAVAWLDQHRLPARLVRLDGSIVRTKGWPISNSRMPIFETVAQ